MSEELCMTLREFRARYGIEENSTFARAANLTGSNLGWRGLKVKVAFAPTGAKVYPVSVLRKIARALGIQLTESGSVVPKEMMSLTCFRGLVPGLSKDFSRNVPAYCNKLGIESAEKPHLYPYWILKKYAEREGKSVPALPGFSDAASDTRTEAQAELPLCELAEDAGSANRETGDFSARCLANQEKIIGLLGELLAAWKGDKQ